VTNYGDDNRRYIFYTRQIVFGEPERQPKFPCFIYPRGINILHIRVTYGNVFDSSIGVFDWGDRCENSVGKDQERRAKNRSAARGDQEP
jgi:hypothetical protein